MVQYRITIAICGFRQRGPPFSFRDPLHPYVVHEVPLHPHGVELSDDCSRADDDEPFRFTDQDESDQAEGKGRMVGDVSGMDWLEFAARPLSHPTRMTYFGLVSHRSIRTVAVEREYRTRVCRECGEYNANQSLGY